MKKIRGLCREDGCERPVHARQLCDLHYLRFRRHGDPGVLNRHPVAGLCSIARCEKKARQRGWCAMHYERWRRYGDPMLRGRSTLKSNYYQLITVNGRRLFEHRWVMEQVLGRRLERRETVHHKNGNRHDNRPENLALRTDVHPKGQDINEVLEFCRDYIKRYGPVQRRLRKIQASVGQTSV